MMASKGLLLKKNIIVRPITVRWIRCGAVRHGTAGYGTIRDGTARYRKVRNGTVRCGTVR